MFRKLNNKGFTIVETLIVLAIAATIIIVVLLAVPGLQRSSRNTTVRTAANNIVAGWNEQMAALNGASPGVPTAPGAGTITINSVAYKLATGVTPTVGTQGATATTVTYNASTAVFSTGGTTTVAPNTVIVVYSATCNGTAAAQGTNTQIAVFYPIENGGTGAVSCIQG
jgi:type II secretory pathway pseudopilin PulG